MQPTIPRSATAVDVSANDLYRQAGFLVSSGDVPFVASVRFLAGPTPDSTYAILALSFANTALTFSREADRYRAGYDVTVEFRADTAAPVRAAGHEEVRVATFRETTRTDESVVFQQQLLVPAGSATIAIGVSDAGSTKRGQIEQQIEVPSFPHESVGWPVVAYAADARANRAALPEVVMNPRSTAVVGRDSIVDVYVESYGSSYSALTLRLVVRDVEGRIVLRDTIPLADRGGLLTGDARLPLSRLGLGLLTIVVSSPDETGAVRVPLIVSFGEDLVVPTHDAMLDYLRYFTSAERLRALREAPFERRAAAWAAFVRQTDATPLTRENEALRDYLTRLSEANVRFREGSSPGWTTDRGMVYAVLGEPDDIIASGSATSANRRRTQVWEYSRHRLRLTFTDDAGLERWRLTPASAAEFRSLQRRLAP